jgi:hypothetical protein
MSLGNSNIHQQGDIPEIVKLPNDRIRVVRRFQKFTREDLDDSNLGSLMGDFGALDTTGEQISGQGYTNCRLISVEVDTRFNALSNADNAVLVKTYETLTSSFVEISDPSVEIEEGGLKKITKVYRAISGTPNTNTVGTTTLPTTGEILANSSIEDNTAFSELTEIYLEAGQMSKTETQGPDGLPDTKTVTYASRFTEPTSNGILLSKDIDNTEGYKIFNYKYLEGATAGSTPIATLQSYEQVIEVRKAGTVQALGGFGSSLPYIVSTPPTIGKVKATVAIELTSDNTVTLPVAYNLSDTSCSVTTVETKKSPLGVEQGTSLTVAVYNTRERTSHQPFSNSYGLNTGASNSVDSPATIIRDNDNIIGESLKETVTKIITISGSTTAPATSGLYDEKLDPVFIDALGTQYYRRTTFTI